METGTETTKTETKAETTKVKMKNKYRKRRPIYINRNENFTPKNGVKSGDGTKENPYIIEGWDISACDEDGIEIKNTDKYFVIRNCCVRGGGSSYDGLVFRGVKNGTIENCVIANNKNGVFLWETSENKIIGSDISKNECGVRLYRSRNLIENSIIEDNTSFDYYIECFSDCRVYNTSYSGDKCHLTSGGSITVGEDCFEKAGDKRPRWW